MEKLSTILDVLSAIYPRTTKTLKVIGAVVVLKKLLSLLATLYRLLMRRRRNFLKRYGRNSWALVTGSSDGIGKAIALALGKQGFNIILSARTEFKLDLARVELRRACPNIDVKILVADYSRAAERGYLNEKIQELERLDISILVNNVGVDVLNDYHRLSEDEITKLININCTACSLLNRLFIPRFQSRHQTLGVRSAIVNVASMAAQIPMPLHNVYSASKAFVDYLSRALSYEYRKEMDILSLRPSEVSTPMTNHKRIDLMTITPKDCAEGLLNQLGHDTVTNGYWSHRLQGALYQTVPESLFNHIWTNHVAPDFIEDRKIARPAS